MDHNYTFLRYQSGIVNDDFTKIPFAASQFPQLSPRLARAPQESGDVIQPKGPEKVQGPIASIGLRKRIVSQT